MLTPNDPIQALTIHPWLTDAKESIEAFNAELAGVIAKRSKAESDFAHFRTRLTAGEVGPSLWRDANDARQRVAEADVAELNLARKRGELVEATRSDLSSARVRQKQLAAERENAIRTEHAGQHERVLRTMIETDTELVRLRREMPTLIPVEDEHTPIRTRELTRRLERVTTI